MSMRWRDLLSHLHIPWTDRGRNVSRGWIAVRCPWCGTADPSNHLTINEEHGGYRCFRATSHSGRSPYWLLRALGVQGDLDALLAEFGDGRITPVAPIGGWRQEVPASPFARRWNSFTSAARDPRAMAYLGSRGFWNPARTAERFDLRVSDGRWAARLWFPLTQAEGEVVGFTGRAMDNDRQPRYLTEAAEPVLYLPEWPTETTPVTILVEGPVDALKLAEASGTRYDFAVAALCGLALTPRKREILLALARVTPTFFVVLDSTVSPVDVNKLLTQLRPLPLARLARVVLPAGVDDPGEMSGAEIEQWLRDTIATAVKM